MITKSFKGHKEARILMQAPDFKLEVVGANRAPFLMYKLTIIYNGCKKVCFFAESLEELMPAGAHYMVSPFTAFNVIHLPCKIKTIQPGAVAFPEKITRLLTIELIYYNQKP